MPDGFVAVDFVAVDGTSIMSIDRRFSFLSFSPFKNASRVRAIVILLCVAVVVQDTFQRGKDNDN